MFSLNLLCTTLLFSQIIFCDVRVQGDEVVYVPETSLINEIGKDLIVPVYFHTSEKNKGTVYFENIIMELNNRFGGVFVFELKGYSNISNALSGSLNNLEKVNSKHQVNQMNVYLFQNNGDLKGRATFPGAATSYVTVFDSDHQIESFDMNNLVHEIGHYFGLLHTFSKKFGKEEVIDRSKSHETGDLLTDTPAEYNTIIVKNKFNGNEISNPTILSHDCSKICGEKSRTKLYKHSDSKMEKWDDFPIKDHKGNSYGVLPNNYMSYVIKGCEEHQFHFTNGQKRRMTHFYKKFREEEYATKIPEPIIEVPDSSSDLYRKVNRRIVTPSEMEFDGVYAQDSKGYKEVLYNKARKAHYVYCIGSSPWNYPKVNFLLDLDLTEFTNAPKVVKLVGSHFTNEGMNELKISSLEHFKSGLGNMMNALNETWRDGERIFIPRFDTKERAYEQLEFKKRKVSDNEYELLLVSELVSGKEYIIHSKEHFWVFKVR